MKKSHSNNNSFSQEWIEKVAEKIKSGITQKLNIVLINNSVQSFIDHRMDGKTKSTIYIGTFKNSEGAIIGALAHEIAHFLTPPPNLPDKFYYKAFLKLTASNRITNKLCEYIHFFNLSTFRNESRVDRLGVELLKQSSMNPDCMKEMLKCLLKSNNLNTIKKYTTRLRLQKLYIS